MMILDNKKIKILVVILPLIILFFLIYTYFFTRKNINMHIVPDQQEEPNFKTRNDAINLTIKNLDVLPKKEINGDTYLLAWYQETKFQDDSNTYKPAGFVVFKLENGQPVLFWESKEEMNNNGRPRFQNIDNDNLDEIIWEGDLSVTGSNNSFYVYRFENNNLKLITPTKTLEGITPNGLQFKSFFTLLSGDSELTYIKDLDSDHIQEITVGHRDENDKIVSKIYKYNGSKYYLWKETPVTIN